jgi:hypothetical protein
MEDGMSVKSVLSIVCITAAGLALIGSMAIADASKDAKAPADIQLPPGMTLEDVQACMLAATPGKEHKFLTEGAGEWTGKTTMHVPGADAQTSDCVSTTTPMMGGRFVRVEIKGEMPGMGPFEGFGIYGYDNVSKKYVHSWVDNQGTGMMHGTGELSADGKTLTWNCTYNCPMAKKAVKMREVETITGPNTKRFEMYGPEPKTDKEVKMMTIEFTKKS